MTGDFTNTGRVDVDQNLNISATNITNGITDPNIKTPVLVLPEKITSSLSGYPADSLNETQTIDLARDLRSLLFNTLGKGFIGPDWKSEDDVLAELKANAEKAKLKDTKLIWGEALTEEQIANLTEPILWFEDGKYVVYFPKGWRNDYENNIAENDSVGLIIANNIDLKANTKIVDRDFQVIDDKATEEARELKRKEYLASHPMLANENMNKNNPLYKQMEADINNVFVYKTETRKVNIGGTVHNTGSIVAARNSSAEEGDEGGNLTIQADKIINERRTANAVDYVKTYGGGLFGSSNMTRVEYQELQPGGNMVGSNITLLGNTHTPEEKAIIGDTEVRNKGGKIIAIPTVTEKTDSVTGDKTYDVTDGNIYIDADNVINEVAEGERVVSWDPGNLGKFLGIKNYDLASVYEPGVISGNNITIVGDTFRNIGSDVLAENSVLIAADSLIEQNWVASHHTINDSARISGFFNITRNTETEHVTRNSTIASNSGDVTLMTQGTFRNTASDIFAGNNIDISANKVEISDGVHQSLNNYSSVNLNFSAPSTISLDYQSTDYTVTTHRSSNFLAGNNLAIHSNTNLDITGSNLAAGNLLSLSAQNINIQNGLYTDTVNTTGGGLFIAGGVRSATVGGYAFASNSSFETLTPSTLFAKDILINASDTTNIKASILGAEDSLTINTNNLLISGEYQRSKLDTVNGSVSLTFVPPTNFSVGVSGGYSYSREGIYQEAVLNAPNLKLNAGNQSIDGATLNGIDTNPHSDYSEQHSYSASIGIGTTGISGGIGYDDFSLSGGMGKSDFISVGYKQFSLGAGNSDNKDGSHSTNVFGSAYGVGFGLSKRIDNPGITNDHPVYTPFVSYGILGLSADFQHGEIKTISSSVGFWTGTTPEINNYDLVCFEKDTPIETREKIKFIQEIKVGDIVKTWNENIKKFEYKKVLKVFQRIAKQTLHIKLSNNQIMKVTPEHLIYANGVWIKAGEIKQGDKLLGLSNEEIFVESIELIDKETRVYNFETEDNHTYIAYGVVVHNTCIHLDKKTFFGDNYSYWVDDETRSVYKDGKELTLVEVSALLFSGGLDQESKTLILSNLTPSEKQFITQVYSNSLDLKIGIFEPPIGKIKVVSRIKDSPLLVREAGKLTGVAQKEVNHLAEQLLKGNLNPGIGTKSLGGGISYARGRNGARLFFREVNGTIELLGKSIKSNEQAVINEVKRIFGH